MVSSRWEERLSFFRKAFSAVAIVVLLLILTIVPTCKYLSERSPEARKPLFIQMNSFSASNFSITTSALDAEWKANLTFENRDEEFEISIKPFETYLYHNKTYYGVSCSSVEPIHLKQRRQKKVLMKFNSIIDCGGKQSPLEGQILKEIGEEKQKGNLVVNLEMNMQHARYKKETDYWDLRQNISCSHINVTFVGAMEWKYMGDVLNCSISW